MRPIKAISVALVLMLIATSALADQIFYAHTDVLGNVVLVTDEDRNIVERRVYEPYGLPEIPIPDGLGYTGHDMDGETGLVYMQQRYYDPEVGRFLSPDPMAVNLTTAWNFNRYNYAANNPYRYTDPDGRAAVCLIPGPMQVCAAAAVATVKAVAYVGSAAAAAIGALVVYNEATSESGETAGASEGGNTNPYDGPVEAPVIVVDGSGNAIPIGSGEQIGASDNGDYQQVKDRDGNPTGVRLDRGGHRGHADPKAQAPHGHRPGVTDEAGNPHLPVNPPKSREPKLREDL